VPKTKAPTGDFASTIAAAYATHGDALELGRGVLDGKVFPEALVQIPLRMMNRHGLIAGATGTGKTKGLQGIAEQLSDAGVPVFAADMKGDLSGLSEPLKLARRPRASRVSPRDAPASPSRRRAPA
jgi:hypothetical protein